MVYLLFAVSLGVNLIGSGIQNVFSKRRARGMADHLAYTVISYSVAIIALLFFAKNWGALSGYTVILGIAYGAVTVISSLAYNVALSVGPLSYTVLINASSLIIPAFSGALFWGESFSALQIVGVGLMIFSFYLGMGWSSGGKKISRKWIVLAFVSFLCNGAVGVMQKMHQSSPQKDELNEFLVIAFAVSLLVLMVSLLIVRLRGKKVVAFSAPAFKPVAMAASSGGIMAFINQSALYLSGVLPAIFFFPAYNGFRIFLTAIMDRFVFKERLTKRQVVGIGVGLVAILLLSGVGDLLYR